MSAFEQYAEEQYEDQYTEGQAAYNALYSKDDKLSKQFTKGEWVIAEDTTGKRIGKIVKPFNSDTGHYDQTVVPTVGSYYNRGWNDTNHPCECIPYEEGYYYFLPDGEIHYFVELIPTKDDLKVLSTNDDTYTKGDTYFATIDSSKLKKSANLKLIFSPKIIQRRKEKLDEQMEVLAKKDELNYDVIRAIRNFLEPKSESKTGGNKTRKANKKPTRKANKKPTRKANKKPTRKANKKLK
jgi:hypothetical protein